MFVFILIAGQLQFFTSQQSIREAARAVEACHFVQATGLFQEKRMMMAPLTVTVMVLCQKDVIVSRSSLESSLPHALLIREVYFFW
jgi:hypothetical protein